ARLASALEQSGAAPILEPRAALTAVFWQSDLQLTLRGHEGDVLFAAFSRDGKRVVTGSLDNTARIWDAITGEQIAVLSGHEKFLRSAAFSPDGALVVTASFDNTARIWEAATGKEIAVQRVGINGLAGVAKFSPDGTRVITVSEDLTVRIRDV